MLKKILFCNYNGKTRVFSLLRHQTEEILNNVNVLWCVRAPRVQCPHSPPGQVKRSTPRSLPPGCQRGRRTLPGGGVNASSQRANQTTRRMPPLRYWPMDGLLFYGVKKNRWKPISDSRSYLQITLGWPAHFWQSIWWTQGIEPVSTQILFRIILRIYLISVQVDFTYSAT